MYMISRESQSAGAVTAAEQPAQHTHPTGERAEAPETEARGRPATQSESTGVTSTPIAISRQTSRDLQEVNRTTKSHPRRTVAELEEAAAARWEWGAILGQSGDAAAVV